MLVGFETRTVMESATLPQRLRLALSQDQAKTLHELSAELGVAEKELPSTLAKLERTLKREHGGLAREPARCIACGFAFTDRTRFLRPGRCPRCRSERIAPARYLCV